MVVFFNKNKFQTLLIDDCWSGYPHPLCNKMHSNANFIVFIFFVNNRHAGKTSMFFFFKFRVGVGGGERSDQPQHLDKQNKKEGDMYFSSPARTHSSLMADDLLLT